jgi:hypothetical protein
MKDDRLSIEKTESKNQSGSRRRRHSRWSKEVVEERPRLGFWED